MLLYVAPVCSARSRVGYSILANERAKRVKSQGRAKKNEFPSSPVRVRVQNPRVLRLPHLVFEERKKMNVFAGMK